METDCFSKVMSLVALERDLIQDAIDVPVIGG